MEEIVELRGQTRAASPRDVVQQFIHEDECRASRQHAPQDFPCWGNALLIMLGDRRKGGFATKLPGDLAPGGFPAWLPRATTPHYNIELRSDEDRNRRLRDSPFTCARLRIVSTPFQFRAASPPLAR